MAHLQQLAERAKVPPEQMTARARRYLAIASLRHVLIALTTWLAADQYRSSSFDQIRSILPLWCWGVVFAAAGSTCAVAALIGREAPARIGLILSAASSALWAGGFVAAYFAGQLSSPTGVIIWWAVTLKDLVVCEQPMRSPFEPLVRQVLNRRAADRKAS